RLSHRGGVDADGASGDGAGLLTAIPHKLITRITQQLGIHPSRTLGVGMLFIQAGEETRVQREVQSLSRMMGTDCLGWREVPTRDFSSTVFDQYPACLVTGTTVSSAGP